MEFKFKINNPFARKQIEQKQPKADVFTGGRELYSYSIAFDGEKNFGEIGPVKDYWLDYESLRLRGWEARLLNEVAQTILKKYKIWVIGEGLKLKCDPIEEVLESEGISIKSEEFNEIAEARFKVWAKSAYSGFNGMDSLNKIADRAFDSSITGGDVLVVIRYVDKCVKIELIDGCHVASPMYNLQALPNGNRIINGIETSPRGEHIAYHIRKANLEYERIEATNKQGLTVAFLVYGQKHRIDNNRGIGLLTSSLESLAKIDRYKEATVGTAEEQAKVAYQIVHGRHSTGDNPLETSLRKVVQTSFDATTESNMQPVDVNGNQLRDTVAVSTNKQVFNNTPDSEIKPLMASSSQFYFKEFVMTNIDLICAGIGIPPNVAMSLYNDSFSASRAATKDWEHTLFVVRADFSFQFYQKIYNFWLHTEILKMKIDAPGYLKAFQEKNMMVLDAYRNARFTGSMFPHIDPLKEVNAERAKLGALAVNLPLTTVEAATEALNTGDSDANMRQFSEELKYAEDELGLETEEPLEVTDTGIKSKKKEKIEEED